MQSDDRYLAAVRARAQKRFKDYDVDLAYAVCLPVYDLRLRVVVQQRGKLSTAAHFVLKLANAGVAEVLEIQRLLGLSEADLATAAAELLSASLVVQRPDMRLDITDLGRTVHRDAGRTYQPRNRHPRVAYDPLVRAVSEIDLNDLMDRENVRKEGLFVAPTRPRRPRLSQIRIDEVQQYENHFGNPRRRESEILQVADIKDFRLRYRSDIVLVKLSNRQSRTELFAAYRAQQYLERESEALQRRAASGANLVPEDVQPETLEIPPPWMRLPPQESSVAGDIATLDRELGKAEAAVSNAEASRSATQDDHERTELAHTVEQLRAQERELRDKLRQRQRELEELSRGEARLVTTEDHRPLLFDAVRSALAELTIASAWINSRALDDELCEALAAAIDKGVTMRIAWGMGTRGRETQRNRINGDQALDGLIRRLSRRHLRRLIVKRTETHEKFLICDDRFCVCGSFNWLSYRGERDDAYRRETSLYSERREYVDLWKANAATLFA